jgi:hypothetical protein
MHLTQIACEQSNFYALPNKRLTHLKGPDARPAEARRDGRDDMKNTHHGDEVTL